MMPILPEIEIVPGLPELGERVAGEIVHLSQETISRKARFTLALAGGSTPRPIYTCLAGASLDWSQIQVFWGDERCVPPDHPDSNYRMAEETLLSKVPIPVTNIHRILGDLPVKQAARSYELELHRLFGEKVPIFDLVLLGLGGDGHTASLFPGSPVVQEKLNWVSGVRHRLPPPPLVDRVTLTLPVLNAAANVFFIVSGMEKAERLARVLYGSYQKEFLPAQAVRPVNGNLRWFVDQAAAALFPPHRQH
jgi:6-phosphogluconolactonase